MRYIIFAFVIIYVLFIAGCRVIWTDDLFMFGLFTDVTAENASLTSDPNRLEILAEKAGSETDDIEIEVDPVTRTLRLKTD